MTAPELGTIVIYWPGLRRHRRPAVVAHVFATGDLGLHVCWAPTDGRRNVPDLVEYRAPVDGIGHPETWCRIEDLVPKPDASEDVTPAEGTPKPARKRRKRG